MSTGKLAAVVALKAGPAVKSRFTTLSLELRQRLAWAMALDTMHALSHVVDQVLVISNQTSLNSRLAGAGLSALTLGEPAGSGINGALEHGAEVLRASAYDTVLACVGDLPALRSSTVRDVVAAASLASRAFVPDLAGSGTTMLIAHQAPLAPAFQGPSAARHEASGARRLTADLIGPAVDARCDVDTEADLEVARSLGLGPMTAALLESTSGRH